ncbi:MAG: polyprenyl synthetase family protein [Ignavibacteria bacterium]|nr:polyprenyl synthetase family protein [Ignavibacteria bacterium]
MEDYDSQFNTYLELIEGRLKEVTTNKEPSNLYEPVTYIVLDGGKRIRPLLCLLACEACGGSYYEAIDAAVAIELLHNFTLVHDDIMDNSPLRRGKPTIHTKWDIPTAILSGDVMVGIALDLLSYYSNYTTYGKFISQLTYGYIEVCEGQALDMLFNSIDEVSEEDYYLMIKKKTAAVIQTSLVIGGLCAGAIESNLNTLREFGLNLGLAFQLQDDLLDLYGTDVRLGKKKGNDILEKKKTLLVLLAKKYASNEKEVELINKLFSSDAIVDSDIPKYDALFKKYNIYEKVRAEVTRFSNQALSTLGHLPKNKGTKMLEYLVNKLNVRTF